MLAQYAPYSGRCEGLRYVPIVGDGEQLLGIGGDWSREIHLRENRRYAHRRVEQCEQREAAEINAARLDVVFRLDFTDLCVEHPLLVEHTFRWAGAAGREDNCGGVVGG